MTFAFDIDPSDLERKLARLADELDASSRDAVDAVVQRVVNHAKTTTLFVDRTGHLRQSIRSGPDASGTLGRGIAGTVIAGGQLPEGGSVEYAKPVHNGSVPHIIRPRNARALRIPTGSGFVFRGAVSHPGTSPRPFMTQAVDAILPQVPAIVDAFTTRALRRAGLA